MVLSPAHAGCVTVVQRSVKELVAALLGAAGGDASTELRAAVAEAVGRLVQLLPSATLAELKVWGVSTCCGLISQAHVRVLGVQDGLSCCSRDGAGRR